jgi:predicted GH43/DUF377 family glycosyl hydrolase
VGVFRRRLISRGDIAGSDGGIYNPGAVATDEGIVLICRREIDYRFSGIVHAERILLNPDTLEIVAHSRLRPRGYPDGSRIEDLRCMTFEGRQLAIHTLVQPGRIRPMISQFDDRQIEPWDALDVPLELAPVEKNWILFEHAGALHCIYRLDPLTILVRDEHRSWRVLRQEDNGWSIAFENMLSNSANLIPFMDGYLGFWHSIVEQRYVQGAVLLGSDLQIRYRTGVLLDGSAITHGYKAGVLYVSALVRDGGRVLVFYGEADAHCGVAIFDAAELEAELRGSPFTRTEVVRTRFAGGRMRDLFDVMIALQALSRERGEVQIQVYVDDPRLAIPIGFFGIPNLAVRNASLHGNARGWV